MSNYTTIDVDLRQLRALTMVLTAEECATVDDGIYLDVGQTCLKFADPDVAMAQAEFLMVAACRLRIRLAAKQQEAPPAPAEEAPQPQPQSTPNAAAAQVEPACFRCLHHDVGGAKCLACRNWINFELGVMLSVAELQAAIDDMRLRPCLNQVDDVWDGGDLRDWLQAKIDAAKEGSHDR